MAIARLAGVTPPVVTQIAMTATMPSPAPITRPSLARGKGSGTLLPRALRCLRRLMP